MISLIDKIKEIRIKPVIQCLSIIGCSVAILLNIVSCDLNRASNVEQSLENKILHLGSGTEPKDLDPHIVTGVTEHLILTALLEGLISENPKTLAPEPGLASSWQIDKSQTVYTFNLRPEAKWSNGEPLTAKDFIYAWKRLLTPSLAAEYAYQLYYIKNAEAYNKGQLNNFNDVGAKALDEYTLEVTLENPTPFFLSLLTHYSTFPVHQATIEQYGNIDTIGSLWTRPGNYVGNGPFILKEWALNRIITVEKNPHYWNQKNIKLNGIHFYPIDNLNTEERLFRAGSLHVSYSLPIEKIAVYKKNNPNVLRVSPYLGTYYYLFNTTKKPFNDARVRRALAMSIDREKIVEYVTKGGQLPAYTFTPPGTAGYTANNKISFNIEKAKQLLSQAGYPNGENFPQTEILYNTSEGHRKIAVAIQQMWKNNLNINIGLVNQDWKVYLNNRKLLEYDIGRAGWIGDYADPNTFLNLLVSNSGNNHTGWSNKKYDSLIKQAGESSSQAQRFNFFQQAEKVLLDELPVLPIYTYTHIGLVSPYVKGWYDNILDHHPYQYVEIINPTENQE